MNLFFGHSGTHLSNTPTNLCMELLNFILFCFVLYCYVFVQYCYLKSIQYNAMHKFVGVLHDPLQGGRVFEVGAYSKVGTYPNKYGITLSVLPVSVSTHLFCSFNSFLKHTL